MVLSRLSEQSYMDPRLGHLETHDTRNVTRYLKIEVLEATSTSILYQVTNEMLGRQIKFPKRDKTTD